MIDDDDRTHALMCIEQALTSLNYNPLEFQKVLSWALDKSTKEDTPSSTL